MDFSDQDEIITLNEHTLAHTVKLGISTVRGTRQEQEDTVLGLSREPYYIAAVCDGMGGLSGGELASRIAIEQIAEDFMELQEGADIAWFLRKEALKLDEAVYSLRGAQGVPLEAGTTIVAAIVCRDRLFWMSVGDSRIYFIRDGQISSVTREHNYRLTLDILRRRGMISEEEYREETGKGEALISFLGMGNLSLVDGNEEAIRLRRGDMLLLCSDGLYKSVEEAQILHIVQKYRNAQNAAYALTEHVMKHVGRSQDNTSAVLIQFN